MANDKKDPMVFLHARVSASLLRRVKTHAAKRGLKLQWFLAESVRQAMDQADRTDSLPKVVKP